MTLLNQFRYEQKLSLGNSFRTIVAFGLNAAFPNYEPTLTTDTKVLTNNILVLDSGGQYSGEYISCLIFKSCIFNITIKNNFKY